MTVAPSKALRSHNLWIGCGAAAVVRRAALPQAAGAVHAVRSPCADHRMRGSKARGKRGGRGEELPQRELRQRKKASRAGGCLGPRG